jgi:hypothetical protein
MTIAGLKTAKHARPFRPFTIELADGRRIPVRYPDAVVWIESSGRVFCAVLDGSVVAFDLAEATGLVWSDAEGGDADA